MLVCCFACSLCIFYGLCFSFRSRRCLCVPSDGSGAAASGRDWCPVLPVPVPMYVPVPVMMYSLPVPVPVPLPLPVPVPLLCGAEDALRLLCGLPAVHRTGERQAVEVSAPPREQAPSAGEAVRSAGQGMLPAV